MTPAGSEAPTVEQPALRPMDEPTIREKVEDAMRRKLSSDQTAELALDDLGLELGSLEQTDSLIGLKPVGGCRAARTRTRRPWSPASMRIRSACWRAAAARRGANGNADDSQLTEHGASGTWFLTDRELGGDVDLTKGRLDRSGFHRLDGEVRDAGRRIRRVVDLAPGGHRPQQSRLPRGAHAEAAGDGRTQGGSRPRASGNYRSARQCDRRAAVPDLEPVTLVGSRHQARPRPRLCRHGRSGRRAQHPQRGAVGRLRFAEAGSPAPVRVAARLTSRSIRCLDSPPAWSTTVARIRAGSSSPVSTPSRTWCSAPFARRGCTGRLHLRGPHRRRRARAGASSAFRQRRGRAANAPGGSVPIPIYPSDVSVAWVREVAGAFSRALQCAGAQLPLPDPQSRFAPGAGRGPRHLGTAAARCAAHA